jgi:hypothetical protein
MTLYSSDMKSSIIVSAEWDFEQNMWKYFYDENN